MNTIILIVRKLVRLAELLFNDGEKMGKYKKEFVRTKALQEIAEENENNELLTVMRSDEIVDIVNKEIEANVKMMNITRDISRLESKFNEEKKTL